MSGYDDNLGGPKDLGFNDPYGTGQHNLHRYRPNDFGSAGHQYYLEDQQNPYRHFRNYDKRQWEEAQRADGYIQQARAAAVQQAQMRGNQQMGMAQTQAMAQAGRSPLQQRRAMMAMGQMGGEAAASAGAAHLKANLGADEMAMAAWQRRMAALDEMAKAQAGRAHVDLEYEQALANQREKRRQFDEKLEDQAIADAAGGAMKAWGAVMGGASS